MYLAEADLAPEQELNEIIWKSVKGPNSIMPPPVRAAFVRSLVAAAATRMTTTCRRPRKAVGSRQ